VGRPHHAREKTWAAQGIRRYIVVTQTAKATVVSKGTKGKERAEWFLEVHARDFGATLLLG